MDDPAAQLPTIVDHIAWFQHRTIQDALNQATRTYWLQRARDFANVGTDTCDQIAIACAAHATLMNHDTWPHIDDDITEETA